MSRVLLLLAALSASSCTFIYLFNSDEENLQCGPADVNGTPRCNDGFVCITAADGIERCVKAGFKNEGDACIDSGECKDGAVCADVYADRCDSSDGVPPEFELDCALRDQGDKGLRCRKACNDDFLCGENQRCFDVEGLDLFCQKGTCSTDSDCVAGVNQGICIQEGLNGGRSGLCRKKCDPLGCFDNAAGGCPCADDENCATPPDETALSERAVCLPPGVILAGQTCDAANFCELGATCVPFDGGFSACIQWCRFGAGGAPACNGGTTCQDIGAGALGICQ